MSFRVNTNVVAMGTLRNVQNNTDGLNRSINRLSTGLRINSAADDPAGLIASETFRAQISGLEQASRNNQEAINYARTAEGALDEVSRLLTDARTLAVASANTGTLSSSQIQANQDQLSSIVQSITRISQQTQFGTKKLLDGSSGTSASIAAPASIAALSVNGTWGGTALSSNSIVTLASVTAGTTASYTAATLTGGNVLAGGSFTLNGQTFTFAAGTSGAEVVNALNTAASQTGVSASLNASNRIVLTANKVGTIGQINFVDTNGVIDTAGTAQQLAGTNASATLTIGGTTVNFTGGIAGNDGLTLVDADGNLVRLTNAANTTGTPNANIGRVTVGAAQFQIGANAGQTAQLSLGNFASTQLGQGVVSGANLTTINLSSATNANQALQVIDKAIQDVSQARGRIGNFQRNVLESNIRSLGIAKENLAATESAIRDTDVAAEMTTYTKMQILQQAGLSVLAQANQAPQAVLSLLRG